MKKKKKKKPLKADCPKPGTRAYKKLAKIVIKSFKCVFCEKIIPAQCTGKIQDHCTWCGDPIPADKANLYQAKYCSEKCKKEDVFES